MPVPPPELPSVNRTGGRLVQRLRYMFGLNVKTVDVVEKTIPRFRHDRQRPRLKSLALLLHLPGDHRIAHSADAVCVRDHDRTFDEARLFDPRGARHLAVSVQGEPGAEHLIGRILCHA